MMTYRFFFRCATLSLALMAFPREGAAQDDDYPRREAVEVSARRGIPHALAKMKEGGEGVIRVAFLGGSITAAPGWRVKSLAWLKERYPAAKLEEINAAIGGTGSDLGVFRLGQDVLRHRPDLMFVEFAVNDGGAPPERIQQAMEGIVRQTWAANPETDIIFVYTLSQPFLPEMREGKFSRAASSMEEVADHYGIPSIHFGLEVAAMEKAGTLIFKGDKTAEESTTMVFSTDGVHPLIETGHELYLQAIARAWPILESVSDGKSAKREPGPPLREDHWEAAKLVPISEAMLSGAWRKLDSGEEGDVIARRFARLMPAMWLAEKPGAKLEFRFRGSVAGVYDIVGPDGGQLSVVLDDGEPKTMRRIDGYCTYHRLSKLQIASGLDPEATHTASLTLDGGPLNKAEILFEQNRSDLEKNPEKYADNVWHAGAIMLIGEIVE